MELRVNVARVSIRSLSFVESLLAFDMKIRLASVEGNSTSQIVWLNVKILCAPPLLGNGLNAHERPLGKCFVKAESVPGG